MAFPVCVRSNFNGITGTIKQKKKAVGKMTNNEGVLLDMVFAMSKRDCLSDLKYELIKPEVTELLHRFDPSDYTLRQWSYAVTYIANKEIKFATMDELRAFLDSPMW